MRLIRVFPRRTKATPDDDLSYFDDPKRGRSALPGLFDEADEVHVDCTFTADMPKAERLAEAWRAVTSNVKIGGVGWRTKEQPHGDTSLDFTPGMYIRHGYTFTSRGCPRTCWFSVTGDTRVYGPNGWESIAEVRQRAGVCLIDRVGGQVISTFALAEQVATPSGRAMATHLLDEGVRPVYRVATANGLSLKGTAEHPLLCVNGESLAWKEIADICPGDTVVVRAPESSITERVVLGRPNLRAWSEDRCNDEIITPRELDEDLAWLVGYVIGDGCLPLDGRPAVHVCVSDDVEGRLRRVLAEKFNVELSVLKHQRTSKIKHGWIYSRLVRSFLTESVGINPAEKLRVPPCVFRSPRSVIEAFLEGLWDADGRGALGSPCGYLATVSQSLADDVALLLLSTGRLPFIHTVINEQVYKDGACYRVGVKAIDIIPCLRGVYRSNKSGKWHWRTAKGPNRRGVERRTLNESGLNHPLNRPGWFYCQVASVEPVGEERVYDLAVPAEEAFVANGFVAHNCNVPKKWRQPHLILPLREGWNVLDDNLLACPRPHVEAVFAMLQRVSRRERRRVEFTGGLEARSLEDYQVGLLADLKPLPSCFFAYDPGDPFETLQSAAKRMLAAGFSQASHRFRCYVLIGYPRDTFTAAEKRLTDMLNLGFTPMAMLWQPETPSAERWRPAPDWRSFQRRWVRPAIIHSLTGGVQHG